MTLPTAGSLMRMGVISCGFFGCQLVCLLCNNPVNYIDPSGHVFMLITAAIGAVVGGVIGGITALQRL